MSNRKRTYFASRNIVLLIKCYIFLLIITFVFVWWLFDFLSSHFVGDYSSLHTITGKCTNAFYNTATFRHQYTRIVIVVEDEEYTITNENRREYIENKYDDFLTDIIGRNLTVKYTYMDRKGEKIIASLVSEDEKITYLNLDEVGSDNINIVIVMFVLFIIVFTPMLIIFTWRYILLRRNLLKETKNMKHRKY